MSPALRLAAAGLVLLLAAPALVGAAADETGRLRIRVVDATGAPVPARLEVVDSQGHAQLPAEALPSPGLCGGKDGDTWWEKAADAEALPTSMWIEHPPSGRKHFYLLGESAELVLPAGRYRVTAFRGPEHRTASREIHVAAGEVSEASMAPERWIDLQAQGWYSSDVHIHVSRTAAFRNAFLARWLAAEELHVGNLLEMGAYHGPVTSPQYAFGPPGAFQRGTRIVAPGQENPRTWVLGHAIVLGATSYIDAPDRYLVYRTFWQAAAAQGALVGHAHWGGDAIAMDLVSGEPDFVEVLQFDRARLEKFYMALNLGFPMTATAGTDYRCPQSGPPGAVRFYARVEGALSHPGWLAAVAAGRTFASNGPMIEFSVNGRGVGDAITTPLPGQAALMATVRFDPTRDAIDALEVVRNGTVVASTTRATEPGLMRLEATVPVAEPSWLAARALGSKVRNPTSPWLRTPRQSVAHTSPIYFKGNDPSRRILEKDAVAEARESLDALHTRLSGLRDSPGFSPGFTGFDAATLERDWPALRQEIERSRRFYDSLR